MTDAARLQSGWRKGVGVRAEPKRRWRQDRFAGSGKRSARCSRSAGQGKMSARPSLFAESGVWRQHRQTAQNGCRRKDVAGKQEAKIVPNAFVEKCQKKAVRLVSAERHQKKNVCSAPAEMRQRKAIQSVRAELRQTEAAQSGNARQWQKADAQNGNVLFQQKKAACSAITRRHRRIVRRKSLQHRENAGMRARRFMCARHPARSFTTRWNGRNTVIAQRDMSRNQSDPDAPARQKPG